MHVLHWIAVKADGIDVSDAEYVAMQDIETKLDNELENGSWFDWFVIGGGRWNPDQDPYKSSPNMIISVAKHGKDKFIERINLCIEGRKNEFAEYMQSIDFASLETTLKTYEGNMDYSFGLYPLRNALRLFDGEWFWDSYIFDMEHGSTNTKYILDDLDKDPNSWYLVPVDFHF